MGREPDAGRGVGAGRAADGAGDGNKARSGHRGVAQPGAVRVADADAGAGDRRERIDAIQSLRSFVPRVGSLVKLLDSPIFMETAVTNLDMAMDKEISENLKLVEDIF